MNHIFILIAILILNFSICLMLKCLLVAGATCTRGVSGLVASNGGGGGGDDCFVGIGRKNVSSVRRM